MVTRVRSRALPSALRAEAGCEGVMCCGPNETFRARPKSGMRATAAAVAAAMALSSAVRWSIEPEPEPEPRVPVPVPCMPEAGCGSSDTAARSGPVEWASDSMGGGSASACEPAARAYAAAAGDICWDGDGAPKPLPRARARCAATLRARAAPLLADTVPPLPPLPLLLALS